MNKGSIQRMPDGTVTIKLEPGFTLGQPAFVRNNDLPEPVVPGWTVKDIIGCVAWAQLAYKAPSLFETDFTEKTVIFQNGMFVVNFTRSPFGFVPPL